MGHVSQSDSESYLDGLQREADLDQRGRVAHALATVLGHILDLLQNVRGQEGDCAKAVVDSLQVIVSSCTAL